MAEGIQYAGEYRLEDATLITPSGNFEDVSGIAIEFNIYEDIFVTGLYGDITLVDVDNVHDTLPIVGQEHLSLSLHTPGLEEVGIKHNFSIYAIARREDLSRGGQILKLSF